MLRQIWSARWHSPILSFFILGSLAFVSAQTKDEPANSQNSNVRIPKEQTVKAEVEVRDALREVQKLSASGLTETTAAKAVERLRRTLAQVEKDSELSAERREALKRILKDRIRVLQTSSPDEESQDSQAEGSRSGDEPRLTDQVRVLRLRSDLRKLVKENKMEEPSSRAADSTRDRLDSSSSEASNRNAETRRQLTANRQAQIDRERGTTRALREVDKLGAAPKDDVNYPADWKERTKYRSSNAVAMTDKEKAVFRALNSTITVRFKDSRFEDVIEYIRVATGLPITLDKESMDDAKVTYSTALSSDLKGVTVRFLLRKILADKGLTFIIRNETIEVVTPQLAKTLLVTRTYYVGDLSDSACGLFSSEQANMFMNMIQTSIDPKSWKGNGGEGTITYNPATRSVTIKQSAEFHGVLASGLR